MRRLLLFAAVAMAALVGAGSAAASAAPPASSTTAPARLALPGVKGSSDADMSVFLTAALTDVDAYWTRLFKANDIAEPTVRYRWIPAGRSVIDGCSRQPTDATAAFYCPADDTIYLSESFAGAVRDGDIQGWPSGARTTTSLGDIAVAYVIAHEEAHNIQDELGLTDRASDVKSLELQADCMAGAWAADAQGRGIVDTDDVNVAEATAYLVGDYAVDNPGHHGTPQERETAFTSGYETLDACWAYVS